MTETTAAATTEVSAPRICYYIPPTQFDGTGWTPSLITEDQPGHTPLKGHGACAAAWHWGRTYPEAVAACVKANRDNLGLSPAEVFTIVFSSIFAGAGPEPAEGPYAVILRHLPLTPRPGLRLEPGDGVLTVVEDDDYSGTALHGLALPDPGHGWYLGCLTCKAEITESDAGMCAGCRGDLDHEAAMRAQEQDALRPGDY